MMRKARLAEGASFYGGTYVAIAIVMLTYLVYRWMADGLKYPTASLLSCTILVPSLVTGILAEAIRGLAGQSFCNVIDYLRGRYLALLLLGFFFSMLTSLFALGLMFLTWDVVVHIAIALGASFAMQVSIGLGLLVIVTFLFVAIVMRLASRLITQR